MDIVTTQMKDLHGLTLDERLLAVYVVGRSVPLLLMFERLGDEGKIYMILCDSDLDYKILKSNLI